MKITEEEMLERRQKIIISAFRLFCERGIGDVTLAEIAKKSGVGESTVYRYFDNKTALVLEAFLRLWDRIMSSLEENMEGVDNYGELTGYEQIQVWIDSFCQLYLNHSDFILFSYEAKLYLLRHKVKLDQSQHDMMMHSIRGPCLLALEKGRRDGSIPIKSQSNEDVFFAMWGSIRGYVVKIVIYKALYGDDSPWESHYKTMEKGILSALRHGWEQP